MSEGFCGHRLAIESHYFHVHTPPMRRQCGTGTRWSATLPRPTFRFCIVHQYDREPAWAAQIRNIFQDTDTPPLILIGSCEAWRHNGINQAARDTWIKDMKFDEPGQPFHYRFVLGRECENPGPDESLSTPGIPTAICHSRQRPPGPGPREWLRVHIPLWGATPISSPPVSSK